MGIFSLEATKWAAFPILFFQFVNTGQSVSQSVSWHADPPHISLPAAHAYVAYQ
jgi:hypothetical protein